MMYNPENYFINEKNFYVNAATINTLAIPKEKDSLISKIRGSMKLLTSILNHKMH